MAINNGIRHLNSPKNQNRRATLSIVGVFSSVLDGWMGEAFYDLFNSISVISGRWAGDKERLYAMEPRLRLKRSPSQAGLEPGTARSVSQRFTYCVTGDLI